MSAARREEQGFTLLEVLMAVLVVGVVYGVLLSLVTENLARVGDARRELDVAVLAEAKLRETELRIRSGEPFTPGVDEGEFEEHPGVYYRTTIAPWAIPLPEGFKGEIAPSSVFAPTGAEDPARPALVMLDTRVYREDEDPELATPFVVLLTPPGGLDRDVLPPRDGSEG